MGRTIVWTCVIIAAAPTALGFSVEMLIHLFGGDGSEVGWSAFWMAVSVGVIILGVRKLFEIKRQADAPPSPGTTPPARSATPSKTEGELC